MTYVAVVVGCCFFGSTWRITQDDKKFVNPISLNTSSGSLSPVSYANCSMRVFEISSYDQKVVSANTSHCEMVGGINLHFVNRPLHPLSIRRSPPIIAALVHIQLALLIVELLLEVHIAVDGLEVPKVRHGYGEEEDVRDEVRRDVWKVRVIKKCSRQREKGRKRGDVPPG